MKELRRERLKALLNGPRFKGDRAAFCNAAEITNGRLTQLLDPHALPGTHCHARRRKADCARRLVAFPPHPDRHLAVFFRLLKKFLRKSLVFS